MESFFDAGVKVRAKINDAFASIFSSSLRRRPIDKALLATVDKYAHPENVPNLAVPKTNDVIWDRMRKGPQIVDAHIQKAQRCVSKTLIPLINIMNDLGHGTLKDWPVSDLAQPIIDALRLGCAAFSLLSQTRKEVIRNDMDYTFAKLCTWKYDVMPDQLFGSDVIKQLKELKDTSRQFRDLTQPRPGTSAGYARGYTANRNPTSVATCSGTSQPKKSTKAASTAKTKVRLMRYVCIQIHHLHSCLCVHQPVSRWLCLQMTCVIMIKIQTSSTWKTQ